MPQFDESFLRDCARAESQHYVSYTLLKPSSTANRNAKRKSYYFGSSGDVVASGGSGNKRFYQQLRIRSPRVFLLSQRRSVCCDYVGRYTPSTPNSIHSTPSYGNCTPSAANSSIHLADNNTTTAYNSNTSGVGVGCGNNSNNITSTSGHKNSLKGTKLARRARSFKDDLFEKLSSMRTPTNTLGRANSPNSPRSKNAPTKVPPTAEEMAKSSQSLENHVKDISNALKHFRDVILKKKFEVLPGNGTVILETIASMFAVIQSYTLNENSTVLLSATQQVYQSLGKLIKLCDDVMLSDESAECVSLSNENVREVVDLLEDAVRNLVTLAQQKLKEKEAETLNKYDHDGNTISNHHLMRPPVEVAGQRTSLPDITLTPKERDILEQKNTNPMRASHSTDSILRDTSPPSPPKPPLPNRTQNPPPLPPKRRNQQQQQQLQPTNANNISVNSDLDFTTDFSLMNYGVDHLSVRSRSPDENSSQCSLDSAFNHSREEDELKAASLENRLDEHVLDDDVDKMFAISFVSMKSFRTSTQSVSKRSSEYSFQSSTKSSNSEIGFSAIETASATSSSSSELHSQQMQQNNITKIQQSNITATTNATYSSNISIGASDSGANTLTSENNSLSNRSSIENCEREKRHLHMWSKTNSLDTTTSEELGGNDILPPALPPKTSRIKDRHLSNYDNFDELDDFDRNESPELRQHMTEYQQHQIYQFQSKHQSLIEPRRGSSFTTLNIEGNPDEPPPLPMKKKHILAYMEICSASTHRHTVHNYNINRNAITHSQTMNIMPISKPSGSPEQEIPPALPPKNYKQRKPTPTIITTPPPSPKIVVEHNRVLSGTPNSELMTTVCEELNDLQEEEGESIVALRHNSPKMIIHNENDNEDLPLEKCKTPTQKDEEDEGIEIATTLENKYVNNKNSNELPKNNLPNLLEELNIKPYLILKKENEDGPEVKGGYIDALIVHASRVQKVADNAFSEAFITTFRTFIQPIEVIEKLIHRYTLFFCQINEHKQKAAKETFSLIVRVVNDLTSTDLVKPLLTLLVGFVYQLVCSGHLYLAKLLRNKLVEKVTLYKDQKMLSFHIDMHCTVSNQPSLLDLKASDIAEQMTLLDAELFQKIEIPEVLLFAKEQCEEKSPNLNKFTEHFNKMSYWARSKILMLTDAKEREKHVFKFIKIMKHLRKLNNYNSYLALLSALDSAPIRRLEWQKTIIETLKEYCTLIDSSSSFRVYRQALAETNPPCIPYIGLVLQDLTFVHVGNQDYLSEGIINFSKRWQQYNIIVNMKRFKKCAYPFRRNERIIQFFENFENFLGEEEMWQISENIKPRGKRSAINNN